MLSQRRMDDSTVEEDLGGVGNAIELLQCQIELVVIVVAQGGHPCLDFLECALSGGRLVWNVGMYTPASETSRSAKLSLLPPPPRTDDRRPRPTGLGRRETMASVD